MNIYCNGVAKIRHKSTGEIYSFESDELDWQSVGGDERGMGPEFQYQATIEHDALGLLSWILCEYPEGVENFSETIAGGHEVIEDFEYGLEHEREPDDEWIDYAAPDHPFKVYMSSYLETRDLLAQRGSDDGTNLINRMVFSHQVTAMEAYLCDTLVKAVMANVEAMKRLMAKDKVLKDKKFTLVEIWEDPTLVSKEIKKHLRSVLYHDLPKAELLYLIALQMKILDYCADKAGLLAAIKLRHDCVHRNGSDKDGNKLSVFTKRFVQQTADQIRNLIEQIEIVVQASLTATIA